VCACGFALACAYDNELLLLALFVVFFFHVVEMFYVDICAEKPITTSIVLAGCLFQVVRKLWCCGCDYFVL